jgi:DNA mismatch endonuclease (patch repair protein)
MQAVKSKDTRPELTIRRALHSAGFRYRLHRRDLPGCPDLVFPGRRKIIFVHGCFWHGHSCRRGARIPKTHTDYWQEKVKRNQLRDAASEDKLRKAGWSVLTVWECDTEPGSIDRVLQFLRSEHIADQ